MAQPLAEDRTERAVQVDLFRRAGTARRFALARSLSRSTIELARSAIRRRHPEWSDHEVLLEFVRVHYGADLAGCVRAYVARRRE